jgi:hypothetical protein
MALWSLFLPEWGQQLVTADAIPGSALSHSKLGSVQRAVSGGGVYDQPGPRMPRSWRLRFEALSQDERGLLNAAWQDGGAVWLMDPTQKNLMHPNVASAGAAHRNLDAWAASSGTLGRSTPAAIAPPVLFAHVVTLAAPGASAHFDMGPWVGAANLDPYSVITPVVEAGEQYTFSVYAKIATASPAVTVATKFTHYTMMAGSGVDDIGSQVALSTSWQRLTRSLTVPAGKGRMWNGLVTQASSTTNTIHVTAPQLEKGPSATAWVPGQGPALCVIAEFEEPYSYPRGELSDADVTLVEIGGPL